MKEFSDEYHEIPNVLDRYNTLANANADLHSGIASFNMQMDKQRSELSFFIKEAQNQILVSNSKIAEHQEQLELAKIESAKLERERAAGENRQKEETRLSGEARHCPVLCVYLWYVCVRARVCGMFVCCFVSRVKW